MKKVISYIVLDHFDSKAHLHMTSFENVCNEIVCVVAPFQAPSKTRMQLTI